MLLQGDCLTELQNLEANSVDSIVTDPPYGLGFMGKQWDSLPPGQEVFEQCLRVLKPGGHLLCFGGTRTYHRMAVAVEDAGFTIREQLQWVYSEGFPKSHNIGAAVDKIQGNERETYQEYGWYSDSDNWGVPSKNGAHKENTSNNYDLPTYHHKGGGFVEKTKGHSEWEGWHTALKPSHEPIVLARKPIEKRLSIAQNCLKWGVGAINVDGCRVETKEDTRREKGGWQDSGYVGGKYDRQKYNAFEARSKQGRFPANLCHDGSDEVVGLFPVTSSRTGAIRKNAKGQFGLGGDNEHNIEYGDTGSAARFFYSPKAKKKERLTFNNHPTVKPVRLMQYLVRLITPAGGTCLDPFAGSGTTGLACMKEGCHYILIDADSQSLDIARRRLLSEIASQEWPLRNYHLL